MQNYIFEPALVLKNIETFDRVTSATSGGNAQWINVKFMAILTIIASSYCTGP